MNLIECMLKEEIADKYELSLRYEHRTNSVVVEVRDGLMYERVYIQIGSILGERESFEYKLVTAIRHLINKMEENKKRQERLFEKEKEKYLQHI